MKSRICPICVKREFDQDDNFDLLCLEHSSQVIGALLNAIIERMKGDAYEDNE